MNHVIDLFPRNDDTIDERHLVTSATSVVDLSTEARLYLDHDSSLDYVRALLAALHRVERRIEAHQLTASDKRERWAARAVNEHFADLNAQPAGTPAPTVIRIPVREALECCEHCRPVGADTCGFMHVDPCPRPGCPADGAA